VYAWNFSKMKSSQSVPVVREIGFSIPNEDWERSMINNVSTSGRDQVDQCLIIKVNINPKLDTIIIWDLMADIEVDSYDVNPESQIMFDSNGETYILEKDHVIINKMGCQCFSYQVEGNLYFNQWKDEKITTDF
jgi:hypothetical protein